MPSKADKTFRLHTDDHGFVWYGDGKTLAKNSGHHVAEFFAKAAGIGFMEAKTFRVLGTRRNASLIISLRKLLGQGTPITLASPQICRTKAARHDPLSVLHALWQPEASSRLPGSWHTLTDYDCGPYAMWAEFESPQCVTEKIITIAQCHPAWRAMSFIPDHGIEASCRLLMYILDPRWYLHPSKPHRFSRLHDYLGLTPKNAKCLFRDERAGKNYDRAVSAFASWYNIRSVQTFATGAAVTPEHFLWRIFRKQQSDAAGLVTATKRLVDLLCFVWLDAVAVSQQERFFQPSMFFPKVDEYQAFQEHTDRWMSV